MNDRPTPLVTLAIICYKQERYIAEALSSAFEQTYSPLEIIVSDDCSPDNTFAIVQQMVSSYEGPHRLILNRNEENRGIAGNVNKVWELASGELVVFQGGDDISLPERTSALVAAWSSKSPRPDLVYSAVTLIDERGVVIGENLGVAEQTPKIGGTISGRCAFVAGGCAAAYARNLHFVVGPLNNDVVAEDFVYSFRSLLGNGVLGLSQPLVKYRRHQASIIGGLRQDSRRYGGEDDGPVLRGALANLREYSRALRILAPNRNMQRWWIERRIASLEMELRARDQRIAGLLSLLFRSVVTVRPQVMRSVARRIVRGMY